MSPQSGKPRLFQAVIDAFSLPDLRRRIIITIGILVAFRFIAHVPIPGVDPEQLAQIFNNNAMLGMLDMFSGGAMRNFSIAAMGVYPYITASIIISLLVPIIPRLAAMQKEGEAGRNRINQWTHWLTVPLAGLSAYGQLVLLQREGAILYADPLATVAIIISLAAGTMFLIWLGELITEYGIGNGISIIIFAGIVAGYPQLVSQGMLATDNISGLVIYIIIALVTVVAIVVFTEAHRRVPVQYARSVFRGGRMYKQSGSSHIPLRVNTAGMIPLIFAVSLVTLPWMIASYFAAPAGADPNIANAIVNIFDSQTALPLGLVYWLLYFGLTIGFAFFYTMVMIQQQDLPGNLQRQGGFIPGIRPGKNTEDYINSVVMRITWAGALYLAVVAIIPFVARQATNIQVIQLSTMGLLIVVGVILDTMKQMEAQLVMRRYEGFIK